MIERETGGAVVIYDSALVDVISERDLMRPIPDACRPHTPVQERMTRHVTTASPRTSVPDAMAIMIEVDSVICRSSRRGACWESCRCGT
jgi:CBS domain-containing protein